MIDRLRAALGIRPRYALVPIEAFEAACAMADDLADAQEGDWESGGLDRATAARWRGWAETWKARRS